MHVSAITERPRPPIFVAAFEFQCGGCGATERSQKRDLPNGWTTVDGSGSALCPDCAQPVAAAGLQAEGVFERTWPRELDDVLFGILGLQMADLGHVAGAYRRAGHLIADQSESEQAFVLHRYIRLWVEHGADWRAAAGRELAAIVERGNARERQRAAKAKKGRLRRHSVPAPDFLCTLDPRVPLVPLPHMTMDQLMAMPGSFALKELSPNLLRLLSDPDKLTRTATGTIVLSASFPATSKGALRRRGLVDRGKPAALTARGMQALGFLKQFFTRVPNSPLPERING